MNQAGPSCGWKPRRQDVHSVAAQRKASTTIDTRRSCPQSILVADILKRGCLSPADIQQQSIRRRDHAHPGVEIGGSEREVALVTKAPVHATGAGNAVHLPVKVTFEGRYPGHELETQAIVDHGEAAGCE